MSSYKTFSLPQAENKKFILEMEGRDPGSSKGLLISYRLGELYFPGKLDSINPGGDTVKITTSSGSGIHRAFENVGILNPAQFNQLKSKEDEWQRVYDEAYEDSEEENDRPACAKIANANARKKNL